MLIRGRLEKWISGRRCYPDSSPANLPKDIDNWWAELRVFLRADISFFNWSEAHVFAMVSGFDPSGPNPTDEVETIRIRLKRLAERLRDGGAGSDLVWEEEASFPDDWRKHQPGQSDKERLRIVAKALEQVAQWVRAGARGYGGKLRKLRDDLDYGRGLPAHAKAVDSIRDRLDSVAPSGRSPAQSLLDECAERFECLARGIYHFCDSGKLPAPPHPWEAPSHLPLEVRTAAQSINVELHRVQQFCVIWTLNGVPPDHPCHEPDCAQELWAMEWYRLQGNHSDKMNAKVILSDGDWLAVHTFLKRSAPAVGRGLKRVLQRVKRHNQVVDRHRWTRSHLDHADDDMPDFSGYAMVVGKLAIIWRTEFGSIAALAPSATQGAPLNSKNVKVQPRGCDPKRWTGSAKIALLKYLRDNPQAQKRVSIARSAKGAGARGSILANLVDLKNAGWLSEGEMGTCLSEKGIRETEKKIGRT
jgi:hypothetical protein